MMAKEAKIQKAQDEIKAKKLQEEQRLDKEYFAKYKNAKKPQKKGSPKRGKKKSYKRKRDDSSEDDGYDSKSNRCSNSY